jgi:16S rRNA G966 N2-methylase RsmD
MKVDIHSHILPDIDDGARTLEESVQLVTEMAGWGFERITCTPHITKKFRNTNESIREKFDIIFLDPPYEAGVLEPVIAHIAKFDILSPHGIIVAEHPANKALPALSAPYRLHRTYRYGKIALTIYRRNGNEENEE